MVSHLRVPDSFLHADACRTDLEAPILQLTALTHQGYKGLDTHNVDVRVWEQPKRGPIKLTEAITLGDYVRNVGTACAFPVGKSLKNRARHRFRRCSVSKPGTVSSLKCCPEVWSNLKVRSRTCDLEHVGRESSDSIRRSTH